MPRWNRMLTGGAEQESEKSASPGRLVSVGVWRSQLLAPLTDLLMLYPKNSVTICALPLMVMVFFVLCAVRDMTAAAERRERGEGKAAGQAREVEWGRSNRVRGRAGIESRWSAHEQRSEHVSRSASRRCGQSEGTVVEDGRESDSNALSEADEAGEAEGAGPSRHSKQANGPIDLRSNFGPKLFPSVLQARVKAWTTAHRAQS